MSNGQEVVPVTEEEQVEVAQQRIEQLEQRLRDMPKGRPFEKGVVRFNLGVAYAESPAGDRQRNLTRGLENLRRAADLFERSNRPMELARTLNVIGTTLREMAEPQKAAEAFKEAADMVPPAINPGEYGAPMNNLGLALLDQGKIEEAEEAFLKALEVFSGPEFLRQRINALHNMGQALSSKKDAGEIKKGIEYYEQALEITDPQEFPYQWALLHASSGVAFTAIDEPEKAEESFQKALRVFSRGRWPFQHALTKNNLAMANIQIGDVKALRRAVAACEEAIVLLDVRMHRDQWEQVYKNLALAEKALEEKGEKGTRAEHFARLLADEDDETLTTRMRERLTDHMMLPEPRRTEALAELDVAILGLGAEQSRRVSGIWLNALMELPHEEFVSGLKARMIAIAALGEAEKQQAIKILDRVIQEGLLAPQRIRVRDTLYEMGYDRPED